jgi:hypothetical protein
MKTFILKICLLSVLIIAGGLPILLYNPPHEPVRDGHYIAAIIDKHRRLESTPPPRLIFVGGSNLAFGIDSQRIEKATGIPTINMGLHAGLSMPFMLKEVEPNLRKGDVVILCFEYNTDFLLAGDQKLQTFTVSIFPGAVQYLDVPAFARGPVYRRLNNMRYYMMQYIESIQQTAVFGKPAKTAGEPGARENWPYSRAAFSERGDVVGHLDREPPQNFANVGRLTNQDDDRFIARLNEFARIANSRGASVYFMFPPCAQSIFEQNYREITKYRRVCAARLKVKILNTPEEFAYPDDQFFDTVYHLNKMGRDVRTTMTIQMLGDRAGLKGPDSHMGGQSCSALKR